MGRIYNGRLIGLQPRRSPLRPQRRHRIDARRPPCRQITGDSATSVRPAGTATNVSGSVGLTENSSAPIHRVRTNAEPSPSSGARQRQCHALRHHDQAQHARRLRAERQLMPISRVRCETM